MIKAIRRYFASPAFRESARRAARTFAITFLAILVPGVLGWLHGLTDWATAQGQAPFPDATGLAYLAVAGIGAGMIAVVNLLWNVGEDVAGKKPLR